MCHEQVCEKVSTADHNVLKDRAWLGKQGRAQGGL